MTQYHIRNTVLAQRGSILRLLEQLDEILTAQRVEPSDDSLCCLFAALQRRCELVWPALIDLMGPN